MHYINEETQQEADEQALHGLYPNTSFPIPFSPPDGWVEVIEDEQPEFDSDTQRLERTPAQEIDGAWRSGWEVVELTADEIKARKRARVPESVTTRQAKQALVLSGFSLSSINATILAIPADADGSTRTRDMAEIEWEYSTAYNRNRPVLLQIAKLLKLSDDQLDDLFILAETL